MWKWENLQRFSKSQRANLVVGVVAIDCKRMAGKPSILKALLSPLPSSPFCLKFRMRYNDKRMTRGKMTCWLRQSCKKSEGAFEWWRAAKRWEVFKVTGFCLRVNFKDPACPRGHWGIQGNQVNPTWWDSLLRQEILLLGRKLVQLP